MKYIKISFVLLALGFACLTYFSQAKEPLHPFDDLSAEEIQSVVKIIQDSGQYDKEIRYPVVKRMEPPKHQWLSGPMNDYRHAYVAIFDFKKSMMTELDVDLTAKKIVSAKDLPGIKPPVLIEEYERARVIVRADERWQKAMRDRGITDLNDVLIDMWAPGLLSKEEQAPGQRLLRAVCYKKGKARNFYSRPIEGVIVTVDLSAKKVASIWDLGKYPIANNHRELNEASNQPIDQSMKPLQITQPRGASFKIKGQEIEWFQWKFRYSMDPLQGLQILHVRHKDQAVERSVVYKMSLAEMLVPYGDGDQPWSFRNAFDVGEYGLGKTLHPLELGKDVPSNATLINVAVADDVGGPPVVMPAIALYEKSGGLLWKHRNAENGETDIRYGRKLVMTFMTTIGNYDYGINYIFNMDGTIDVDAQLTGMLLAKGTAMTQNTCKNSCRPLVEGNILAPAHQHFFSFRIDLDIDGADKNTPAEMNVAAFPLSENNKNQNAFGLTNTVLATEKTAARDLNPPTARMWKVFNESSTNALGHPRGYGLMPQENSVPYLSPQNLIRKRAGFIDHHMWFTAYKDNETSGAALYPTTAPIGEGLPKYISNNENLENADVVMWYTFGVTHIPRPEEWPIMSVHHTGFKLVPINFFNENPSMRVPENY